MNILNQLSIWLSFQLSLVFILGIPLTLFFWSIKNNSKAITKLLTNYWKISLLFFISLILLIGKYNYALFVTNVSTLIMTISIINDDSYDIMMTGDYNLPLIDWQTNCVQPGGTQEIQQSAQKFLAFLSDHLLSQYVMCPTRGNNVLDLFITNNDRVVTNVECKTTTMSDHNVVDVMLACNPLGQEKSAVPNFDENS